jgi:hypothetical protein
MASVVLEALGAQTAEDAIITCPARSADPENPV